MYQLSKKGALFVKVDLMHRNSKVIHFVNSALRTLQLVYSL